MIQVKNKFTSRPSQPQLQAPLGFLPGVRLCCKFHSTKSCDALWLSSSAPRVSAWESCSAADSPAVTMPLRLSYQWKKTNSPKNSCKKYHTNHFTITNSQSKGVSTQTTISELESNHLAINFKKSMYPPTIGDSFHCKPLALNLIPLDSISSCSCLMVTKKTLDL